MLAEGAEASEGPVAADSTSTSPCPIVRQQYGQLVCSLPIILTKLSPKNETDCSQSRQPPEAPWLQHAQA